MKIIKVNSNQMLDYFNYVKRDLKEHATFYIIKSHNTVQVYTEKPNINVICDIIDFLRDRNK